MKMIRVKTIQTTLDYIHVGNWCGKKVFAYRKTVSNFISSGKNWNDITEGFCMQVEINHFKDCGTFPKPGYCDDFGDGLGYAFVFSSKSMRAHKRPYTSITRNLKGKVYYYPHFIGVNRRLIKSELKKVIF